MPTQTKDEAETSDMPAVGTDVWFRMPMDPTLGEWLPAKVVDKVEEAGVPEHQRYLEPAYADTIHLKVKLDRKRHHAASVWAYRQNVTEGTEPGQFSREKPANADRDFERAQDDRRREVEYNKRRLAERSPNYGRNRAPVNPVEGSR